MAETAEITTETTEIAEVTAAEPVKRRVLRIIRRDKVADKLIELEGKLFPYQKEVLQEAEQYRARSVAVGCVLSLPMGYGKTIIGLYMALKNYTTTLVVCSKTLLGNWIAEIRKFFGSDIKVEILHQDYVNLDTWTINAETQIVITTSDVCSKSYTGLDSEFAKPVASVFSREIMYAAPQSPFRGQVSGARSLHSIVWDAMIVDECQNFTNVDTKMCRAIASICARRRWLLSGTLFNEYSPKRMLGFFLLLNLEYPRSISDTKSFLRKGFSGTEKYSIIRDKCPTILDVKIHRMIVSFELPEIECEYYRCLRQVTIGYHDEYMRAKTRGDTVTMQKAGGHVLSMICYMRQSLVSPSMVYDKLVSKIAMPDARGVVSQRLLEFQKILHRHSNDRVLVYSGFVESLLTLHKVIEHRRIFHINGSMSISERNYQIQQFSESDNGVFLLTYAIGAEGLNLQAGKVVIQLDLYWNRGKEDQAVARIYRHGQTSKEIYHYLLVSNTGIEKKMLEKQHDKLRILQTIRKGGVDNTAITKLTFEEIIEILKAEVKTKDLAHKVRAF